MCWSDRPHDTRTRLHSLPTCNGRLLHERYVHGKLHVGQNGGYYRGKQEALYLPNEVFLGKTPVSNRYMHPACTASAFSYTFTSTSWQINFSDKQTNRQTDTQNDYNNPRACAPRVNDNRTPYLCSHKLWLVTNTYQLQFDRSGDTCVQHRREDDKTLNTISIHNCVYATMTDSIRVRTCLKVLSL